MVRVRSSAGFLIIRVWRRYVRVRIRVRVRVSTRVRVMSCLTLINL
jgi:hypothetical protein